MRFQLNLATRTYINTRQVNLSLGAVALLMLLLLAINVRNVLTAAGEASGLKEDIARIDRKFNPGGTVPEKDYQALVGKISTANVIIQKKALNWVGLLNRFEGVVPDGVSLSSIQPSTKDGTLQITGEAKSFASLRQFMENLEESHFFTDTYLLAQTEVKKEEVRRGLTFTISCKINYALL